MTTTTSRSLSRAELAAYLILASLFGFCTVAAVMSAGVM